MESTNAWVQEQQDNSEHDQQDITTTPERTMVGNTKATVVMLYLLSTLI